MKNIFPYAVNVFQQIASGNKYDSLPVIHLMTVDYRESDLFTHYSFAESLNASFCAEYPNFLITNFVFPDKNVVVKQEPCLLQ